MKSKIAFLSLAVFYVLSFFLRGQDPVAQMGERVVAYHAGMPSFQPDYLVECARVQDGELCFLSKARHEVELMYQARTRMFRQVYRHPTVIRVEQTLIQCIFPPDIIEWVQENWRTLDDVELTSYLRKSPQYHRMYTRNWADAPAVPEPAAAAESADSVVYV